MWLLWAVSFPMSLPLSVALWFGLRHGNRSRSIRTTNAVTNPLRRHDDLPVDPVTDITHREIPDLTEAQHTLVVKAIYRLPPTDARRELADLFEVAPKREGHPRPMASLDWSKAEARKCSEADLFWDLAHGSGD